MCHLRLYTSNAATITVDNLSYQQPDLDGLEDVEKYAEGGFHPIHLEDAFKDGRYRVIHKLGHGGTSTVWLAFDEAQKKLVSLKVFTAKASRQASELNILQTIHKQQQNCSWRNNLVAIIDSFMVDGPNGTHSCYAMQPTGPNISAISFFPGEQAGIRRIRAPLARHLCQQLAKTVSVIHEAGFVHGDITPKNVLLKLTGFDTWSPSQVYRYLGNPVKIELLTSYGTRPGSSAPEYLVQPASFARIDPRHFLDQICLTDLGETFRQSAPPEFGVGTPRSYCSPELLLEKKASIHSDIWALACTIFELRSGFPMFESFFGTQTEVIDEILRILGPFPTSILDQCNKHGITIPSDTGHAPGLERHISDIGSIDPQSFTNDRDDVDDLTLFPTGHPLLEQPGQAIDNDELFIFADLLRRALHYMPEHRISARKIVDHPWFRD